MDGRARFALKQAQKDAQRSHAKVGVTQDLYMALQRNQRKLNRCHIRASEVNVRGGTSRRLKPEPHNASLQAIRNLGGIRKPAPQIHDSPSKQPTPRMIWTGAQDSDAFALPNYIVEMNKELLEDDFEHPDVDRQISGGHSPLKVELTDIFLGLGDAAAAVSAGAATTAPATSVSLDREQPSGVATGSLAELSVNTGTASDRPATVGATVSRSARDRLLPLVPKGQGPAKTEEGAAPRDPIVETMPQHLPSDLYWVRRPVYVSTQQVRWEKNRDGFQTLVAMRTEIMPKICSDGMPRRMVQTADAVHDKSSHNRSTMSAIGPAEAKIWASENRSWTEHLRHSVTV